MTEQFLHGTKHRFNSIILVRSKDFKDKEIKNLPIRVCARLLFSR